VTLPRLSVLSLTSHQNYRIPGVDYTKIKMIMCTTLSDNVDECLHSDLVLPNAKQVVVSAL